MHRQVDLVSRSGNPSPGDVASAAAHAVVVPQSSRDPAINPETGVAPWGSPMYEPVPVVDPQQRPDTGNAWGRTDTLFGNGSPPSEMARVVLDVSEVLTLSIDVLIAPGTPATGIGPSAGHPLTVWALVTFGGGSTSATRLVRCDYRFDSPLVVSYLSVRCYVGLLDGTPVHDLTSGPDATNFAQVAVQVSRGVRGLPYVGSQFLVQIGTEGVFPAPDGKPGPTRVLSVTAHLQLAAAGERFLQFFDSAGVPGASDVPIAEYPLGTTPDPGLIMTRFLNPRGFSQGVSWGISKLSGQFDAATDPAFVEMEELLL